MEVQAISHDLWSNWLFDILHRMFVCPRTRETGEGVGNGQWLIRFSGCFMSRSNEEVRPKPGVQEVRISLFGGFRRQIDQQVEESRICTNKSAGLVCPSTIQPHPKSTTIPIHQPPPDHTYPSDLISQVQQTAVTLQKRSNRLHA